MMNCRQALTVFRSHPAVVVAVTALLAVLALACGGGGDGSDNPRAAGMAAFIQAAANVNADRGAGGLYDLLEEGRKQTCSRESFVQALSDEPSVSAFKGLNSVSFNDQEAKAKIEFVTSGGDRVIEWELVQLSNSVWRILAVPGIEDCTP